MIDFVLDDLDLKGLGGACLVFWGLIGLFAIWHMHKLPRFANQNRPEEKGKPCPLESGLSESSFEEGEPESLP